MKELPKIKVLRLIARLNVGGPANHCLYLLDLDKQNYETLLVFGEVPKGEESIEALFPKNKVLKTTHFARDIAYLKDLQLIFKILNILITWQPDIVHTHTAKAGFAGRIAGILYRIYFYLQFFKKQPYFPKFVHTYHGHVFNSYFTKLLTAII